MSEKKIYFFRGNNYTYIEMLKRIPKEVLSDEVIQKKGLSQKKAIDVFMEGYTDNPDLVSRLNNAFQLKGRKGDFVNIKLYNFNNFRYDLLGEDSIDIINNLKGKKLNDEVFLGSFLEEKVCFMEDIHINYENDEYQIIDYQFKFQYETIVENNGEMKKEIKDSFVEARHYINERILAVSDSSSFETKAVCNMIYSIPFYVNTKLNKPDLYSIPDYKQIQLNSSQLESIKILLGGNLKSTVLNMKGDRGVIIKIEGQDKDFEKNSITLKQNINKGDKKEVQFYWEDEKNTNNKITIKSECQVISSNLLSEQALKCILDNILLVDNKKELLIPLGTIIDKYCSKFRRALRKSSYISKTKKIMEEVIDIINKIKFINNIEGGITELYCVISINIIIQSLLKDKVASEKISIDYSSYELYDVINIFTDKSFTKDEFGEAINVLSECIKSAGSKEDKLIEVFYSLLV